MGNKFLMGERVVRIMDGLEGKVVRMEPYGDTFLYAVDLGREPMEGFTDDIWSGTEEAWRRARTLHAHVETNSRDCDGDYRKGYVDFLTTTERVSDFGEMEFKERVMVSAVSVHAEHGTLEVTATGLEWRQPTEEGYSSTSVTWCEQEDCDRSSYQRDFRAEAAGY